MAYTAATVANNILQRAFRDNVPVTPMKLQKILFFAASEYSKKTHKPLLTERFEPWQYGPVVRSVYSEFKSFAGNPIRSFAKDAQGQAFVIEEKYDPNLADALNAVWERTKNRDAVDLSRITHLENSAWYNAFVARMPYIESDSIEKDETYSNTLNLGR